MATKANLIFSKKTNPTPSESEIEPKSNFTLAEHQSEVIKNLDEASMHYVVGDYIKGYESTVIAQMHHAFLFKYQLGESGNFN